MNTVRAWKASELVRVVGKLAVALPPTEPGVANAPAVGVFMNYQHLGFGMQLVQADAAVAHVKMFI